MFHLLLTLDLIIIELQDSSMLQLIFYGQTHVKDLTFPLS